VTAVLLGVRVDGSAADGNCSNCDRAVTVVGIAGTSTTADAVLVVCSVCVVLGVLRTCAPIWLNPAAESEARRLNLWATALVEPTKPPNDIQRALDVARCLN
jgi:hypothetical protein